MKDTSGGRSAWMMCRRIFRSARFPIGGPSVEQRLVYEVKLEEVRRAVAALPEKQRAAVLMHKYEDMEYTQIAKVLGCSESAVKSLLFRAYETLRARLAHIGTT